MIRQLRFVIFPCSFNFRQRGEVNKDTQYHHNAGNYVERQNDIIHLNSGQVDKQTQENGCQPPGHLVHNAHQAHSDSCRVFGSQDGDVGIYSSLQQSVTNTSYKKCYQEKWETDSFGGRNKKPHAQRHNKKCDHHGSSVPDFLDYPSRRTTEDHKSRENGCGNQVGLSGGQIKGRPESRGQKATDTHSKTDHKEYNTNNH